MLPRKARCAAVGGRSRRSSSSQPHVLSRPPNTQRAVKHLTRGRCEQSRGFYSETDARAATDTFPLLHWPIYWDLLWTFHQRYTHSWLHVDKSVSFVTHLGCAVMRHISSVVFSGTELSHVSLRRFIVYREKIIHDFCQ